MTPFFRRAALLLLLVLATTLNAETFRVATYNLENYLDAPAANRHLKEPQSKAKIVESIKVISPDLIALQEMGTTNALLELRAALAAAGLEFPFWEHITGSDPNIHLALLSRLPFTARQPHTNETYLLSGRRFHVSRGFSEVEVQVNPRYKFTVIAAHLKSKSPSPMADEAEMREQEALLLRKLVETRLAVTPDANLIVLGDFNDSKDSKPIRAILGRGKTALFDTRPLERNSCETSSPPNADSRPIAWTYYYAKEDSYSRIDYILLSPGMKREWLPAESYILRIPHWGAASDHCPVVCAFDAEDK